MASSVGGISVGHSSLDLRASSSSPLSLLVRRMLSTPLAPCLAYGAISICITLFNKAVFSVYRFQFPAFVTALQVRGGGGRLSSLLRRELLRNEERRERQIASYRGRETIIAGAGPRV